MVTIEEYGKIVDAPVDNQIIGDCSNLQNTTVRFKGKGNVLYLDGKVRGDSCNISFNGDHALVYLSKNTNHVYKLKIDAWRETITFFGKNSYFNRTMSVITSERQYVIVGDEGVFSFGIWIRTADPHLIYDAKRRERINMSRGVIIGDHVWIGQDAMIMKGTYAGSGSVIAAKSVAAGKKLISNAIYAGNPVREKKRDIVFLDPSVHNYTEEQTAASMTLEDEAYKKYHFTTAGPGKAFRKEEFEQRAAACSSGAERLQVVQEMLFPRYKNRFYMAPPAPAVPELPAEESKPKGLRQKLAGIFGSSK